MIRLCRFVFCVAAGLIFAGPTVADTVEDVQKKLNDAHGKVKSYAAKTKMIQDMEMSGVSIKGENTGLILWAKKGDKVLSRIEQKGSMTQNMAGQENKVDMSSLTISDGDFYYTLAEHSGQKMATKQNIDPKATMDVQSIIDDQKEQFTMKVMPDDKVDGADCYVLEGTPKETEGSPYATTTMWFRKADAIPAKMVGKDKAGKEVYSYILSDIKVNEDIPADQFKFTAPEGVEVMDMTGGTAGLSAPKKEEEDK